jgi:hypothetical protein
MSDLLLLPLNPQKELVKLQQVATPNRKGMHRSLLTLIGL